MNDIYTNWPIRKWERDKKKITNGFVCVSKSQSQSFVYVQFKGWNTSK